MAVLLDPEKEAIDQIERKVNKINAAPATHIFVGGSTMQTNQLEQLVQEIKCHTELPVVLFPGDEHQITEAADGLLFLSLISGRNPEYLIEKQVRSIPKLLKSELEIIPTGYLLIDSGSLSSVERVSNTKPLSKNDREQIVHTAKAGELLGMKLIYLEAGSGASETITPSIIKEVKSVLKIPLIVGGGIRSLDQLDALYEAGADMVVVGTAFEQDITFFEAPIQQEVI